LFTHALAKPQRDMLQVGLHRSYACTKMSVAPEVQVDHPEAATGEDALRATGKKLKGLRWLN